MTGIDDAAAFEHYDDPANREPASGPPTRRRNTTQTREVSVALPAGTAEEVARLAAAGGISVNVWIRRAIDSALRRS
jgi:Ribbon-helix-helix protein, copG family